MAPTSRRGIRLLLAAVLAQLVAGAAGVWFLAGDRHRGAAAAHDRYATLAAMANLHLSLADAERGALFAVIQGERLHPDVPASFRACLDRARQECRVAESNVVVPGEAAELEQLAAQVEEVARRGDQLLTAPAGERLSRYHDPGTGLQAAATAAWRHLSTVRALNEVALEDGCRAAPEADWWAAGTVGGLGGLSLVLTAAVAWRQLRDARPAEPATARAPAA